jgi:transmembrane sensor
MTDHLPPSDADNGSGQWDALARFLAGESTPSEAREIRRWFADHPDDANVIAELDSRLPIAAAELFRADTGATSFPGPLDVEGALNRVHTRMETSATPLPLSLPRPSRTLRPVDASPSRRSRWQTGGIAAAAALIVAIGVTSWNASRQPASSVATTYDTKVGASDSIMLPDSSSVILAPGSQLVVAANYGRDRRDVELQGAGQFTVRHDAKKPFTVRSRSAIVRDLGTVFGVKPFAGAGITVSVSQGSVALSDSSRAKRGHSVELKAGDRGHVLADGSLKSERGAVTPDELAWVHGALVYHDSPLADVQADLRRWFGVELVVRDSVWATQTVSTQGVTSEPVGKIAQRLASIWGGVVSQQGDTIFIDRAGVRSRR